MSDDRALLERRIFPRNLTARAATMVRGNPASARPESGVDNTHPGLEFDQRNMDQAFFPGLMFEYQFLTGARLTAVQPALLPPVAAQFLSPADATTDDSDPVHLLYLWGRFGANPSQYRLAQLYGVDGYTVLRTVRDLEPGPLMVVVGRPLPAMSPADLPDGGQALLMMGADLNSALETGAAPAVPVPPVRDANGRLLAAMLVGERAHWLTPDGVIDPALAPAGGLTKSLCAPWQWDFADCGCHYWAANKPDIVAGPDGGPQTLNFQRDRSQPPPAVPDPTHAGWMDGEMTQPAMIRDWETLPFVIAERETDRAAAPPPANEPAPWTRARIIRELEYLAGIEHALAIEYLYAHYSLAAPRTPPGDGADARVRALFMAAQIIRMIAVDEMRHLRWVNEALRLLKSDICLDRATAFAGPEGGIRGSFSLLPLTPERLDYFIAVEAPSRSLDDPDQLDGLYTHLQRSLGADHAEIDPMTRQRVAEIVKMIIDEGHEHWRRFMGVKTLLADIPSVAWLRVSGPPPADDPTLEPGLRDRLALADACYRDLLAALAVAFESDPQQRTDAITDAREVMYNLDDLGTELAELGVGMRFAMPADGPAGGDRLAALDLALADTAGMLASVEGPAVARTAERIQRQRTRLAALRTRPA